LEAGDDNVSALPIMLSFVQDFFLVLLKAEIMGRALGIILSKKSIQFFFQLKK
jgi:hypothetical protein